MSTSPSTLASSWRLHRWLASDAAWKALPLPLRARHAWNSAWGSLNARIGSALASQEAPPPIHDPFLITGLWRTGTTVMHELLSAATGLPTPLTWQCMNACTVRMSGPGPAQRLARPMDGLDIRNDSPQEDEFALLTLGVESAYRAFMVPHRIAELTRSLDPRHWEADTEWLDHWEGFLRDVLSTQTHATGPLILKSPNHTFRLPAIVRRYSKARVVWMARDPVDTYYSNLKMWNAMFQAHGMTAPDPAGLDTFLATAMNQAAALLDWCGKELAPSQFAFVEQEALQSRPLETVTAVWAQIGHAPLDESRLAQAIVHMKSGRIDSYPQRPPAALQMAIEALTAAQSAAAVRWPR